ncbi:MAG TPA: hypothetical protein V6C97_29570 [Oculatellaceae cyanobacterium]
MNCYTKNSNRGVNGNFGHQALMVTSLLKAKPQIVEARQALNSAMAAHQDLTATALAHEEKLAHQWERMQDHKRSAQTRAQLRTDSGEVMTANRFTPSQFEQAETSLQRHRQVSTALTENLYELENLDLALELAGRIIESLVSLKVDAFEVTDLAQVNTHVGKLCEEFSVLAGVTKPTEETLAEKDVVAFKDKEADVEHSFRLLFGLLAQTNEEFHLSYKESLVTIVSELGEEELEDWVQINHKVVSELEQFTTTQREALALWKDRTEFAYEHNDRQLASKAWQRKEEYGSALAKIEETLVAHVEAGAIAQQRLQQ